MLYMVFCFLFFSLEVDNIAMAFTIFRTENIIYNQCLHCFTYKSLKIHLVLNTLFLLWSTFRGGFSHSFQNLLNKVEK